MGPLGTRPMWVRFPTPHPAQHLDWLLSNQHAPNFAPKECASCQQIGLALAAAFTAREAGLDQGREQRLGEFCDWLVRLDEPEGSDERRTVTLTQIIDRAREALG